MLDTIITSVVAVMVFVTGYVIDRRHSEAAQLAEEVDDLREKLKAAEEERDGWKETAESTHKLLQAATERADRLAAMNEGLTEDLAALKVYDPEEIEERLKKIREIRTEEGRRKAEEELRKLLLAHAALMAAPYGWNTINVNDVRAFTDIHRYWTSRPTPEQMRDTPWEGDSDAE